MLKEHNCIYLNQERISESKDKVVAEVPLSIFINGSHFVTTTLSPQMTKEFVIGFLFTEKVINNLDGLESLQVADNIATVKLNPSFTVTPQKRSFLDKSNQPAIKSELQLDADAIFDAVSSILDSELHKATGGVHVVGLFDGNGRICVSEDIGRHNALDKVIGFGLTRTIDLETTFVACTSRISSELVLKCSVANIPVLASRSATTSLAIELAAKTGLCIIGFVRDERMNIYTQTERIVSHFTRINKKA